MPSPTARPLNWIARLAILLGLVSAAGYAASAGWNAGGTSRFLLYLLISIAASRMRVKLPGYLGAMSLNFVFILISLVELDAGKAVIVAFTGALAEGFWDMPGLSASRLAIAGFNSGAAAWAAHWLYRWQLGRSVDSSALLGLIGASLAYFILNTAGAACYFALAEKKPLLATWRDCYIWRFPFYLVGASAAWAVGTQDHRGLWHDMLLLLPALLVIHRAYVNYLRRLASEKRKVEDLAALHLRTIENLALAIEARDASAYDHLRRVRVCAVEIGKSMGMADGELEALRAAALLHDIGELAVPEHILRKKDGLTPEEFERLKLHPVVGAEILSQVEFPYPVAPIVRSHHERWDGAGYPDGLKGAAIPMGARILAAVDYFDGLASDAESAAKLNAAAGVQLDPQVVAVLLARQNDLTALAAAQSGAHLPDRGSALAKSGHAFVHTIAGAHDEAQQLLELTQDLGALPQLPDLLAELASRIKRLVGYDAIAISRRLDERLIPEYVEGESFRLLTSIETRLGAGLSGRSAQTGVPILNGDPKVEFEKADGGWESRLQSAACVPLFGAQGILGVMTLYRTTRAAFTSEHLRVLQAAAARISPPIDHAIQMRGAETNATIDAVTSLPNARSLFLRLDSELARSRRSQEPLAVLTGDLDRFHEINERFGHATGDRVLRLVAAALRDSCREYDFVARIDSNKFVMIFPVSDAADIDGRVAEFREIGRKSAENAPALHGLTMSLGQACFPEDGGDAEHLLAEADRRMYREKRRLRLCIPIPAGAAPAPYSRAPGSANRLHGMDLFSEEGFL